MFPSFFHDLDQSRFGPHESPSLILHQRWLASVYVLPEINSGRSQGFSAIPMKEDGKWGLNVVALAAGFRV